MRRKVGRSMTKKKQIGMAVTVMTAAYMIPFGAAKILYDKVFNKRVEIRKEPMAVKYEDFHTMDRQAALFPSNRGQRLKGYFYYPKGGFGPFEHVRGCIVLSPGIFQGHTDYLYDVERFVKEGFCVFGFDNTGCMESGGRGLLGLEQAVIDLHYALEFLESRKGRGELPILLYGHSMGGYAVAAVLHYDHKVDGIVSRSGFSDPTEMLCLGGKKIYGNKILWMLPFLRLYRRLLFWKYPLYGGIEGILKRNIPAFILHSEDDPIVDLSCSLWKHCQERKTENVKTYLCRHKGHDIVRSDKALAYFQKMLEKWERIMGQYRKEKNIPQKVKREFLNNIDMKQYHVHDEKMMERIVCFFIQCTGGRKDAHSENESGIRRDAV
jgi:alpha-beta hydrolase superfamily lysophospholipase